MAHSVRKWERAKLLFEAGASLGDITKETGISKPQLSKMSHKWHWSNETEKKRLIDLEVEIEMKKKELDKEELKIHDKMVYEKVRYLTLFNNSAIRNQKIANKKLTEDLELQDLEMHSRITSRNKETVMGKQSNVTTENTSNINIKKDTKVVKQIENMTEDEAREEYFKMIKR